MKDGRSGGSAQHVPATPLRPVQRHIEGPTTEQSSKTTSPCDDNTSPVDFSNHDLDFFECPDGGAEEAAPPVNLIQIRAWRSDDLDCRTKSGHDGGAADVMPLAILGAGQFAP
jgi:hypothetical protein